MDSKPLVGYLAASNYFQSIDTTLNKEFVGKWTAFTRDPKPVTTDPMAAHATGFAMWVTAVQRLGTADPDKVIDSLPGTKVPSLTGGTIEMLPNHHVTKPAFVAQIGSNNQFNVIWKTDEMIPAEAWSKELPGSRNLIGDWVTLRCGRYDSSTRKCSNPL